MKVILLKEVRGRGGEGDVIEVSRGFANNYLLTQGYAVLATPGNLKQLEQRKKNIAKREEVRVAEATALVEKLDGAKVTVVAQVGEEGQLFGSVTASMIADAVQQELGIEVDRRRIELGKPIKQVGEYPVAISIYRTMKATITVIVDGEQVEGEAAETVVVTDEETAENVIADEAVEVAEAVEAATIAAEVEEAAEKIEAEG